MCVFGGVGCGCVTEEGVCGWAEASDAMRAVSERRNVGHGNLQLAAIVVYILLLY